MSTPKPSKHCPGRNPICCEHPLVYRSDLPRGGQLSSIIGWTNAGPSRLPPGLSLSGDPMHFLAGKCGRVLKVILPAGVYRFELPPLHWIWRIMLSFTMFTTPCDIVMVLLKYWQKNMIWLYIYCLLRSSDCSSTGAKPRVNLIGC